MPINFGNGLTNYTGEVLEDILTYTAEENETYKEGLIHIKAGIQKKYALPMVKLGSIIQDHVATPTSSKGKYEFSERYLEPNDFMIYIEFNPREFEKYYKFAQPNGNLVFRALAPEVQAKMVRLLLEKEMEYINSAIWNSATAAEKAKVKNASGEGTVVIGEETDAGPQKYFNGAIMRMLMNAAASAETEEAKGGQIIKAGTGSFADGQAVEKELYAMWKVTPPKVRKKAGLVILMDYATWDMYDEYVSSKEYKYTDNRKENQHMFRGKRIIPMTALPENTIIIGCFTSGVDSNLWMGVDYANDENVLQVDKLQNNSEFYFFKMLLKMDVNIVKPAEIVAHLPFTYGA